MILLRIKAYTYGEQKECDTANARREVGKQVMPLFEYRKAYCYPDYRHVHDLNLKGFELKQKEQ